MGEPGGNLEGNTRVLFYDLQYVIAGTEKIWVRIWPQSPAQPSGAGGLITRRQQSKIVFRRRIGQEQHSAIHVLSAAVQ